MATDGMRFRLKDNVFDKALERMRWLFDEFPEICVSFSGGKDSTVVFELAKIVAKEKNRLPLKVFWLDQECEFQATEDIVKKVMYDPDVEPMWYQIPFRLQNATSSKEQWLNCWAKDEEWAREQDPISFKENTFGTDRFVPLMTEIMKQSFNTPVAILVGVRAEESPARMLAITGDETYKGETWGKKIDSAKGKYNFFPIYDWTYTDIWKAIHEHQWEYNDHYNSMFRYGVTVRKMRVSNYHHETAVHALFMLQEIEPETYEKATRRIGGLDTAGKMGKADWFVYEVPFMFSGWQEYRDYLLENLITDSFYRDRFAAYFKSIESRYSRTVGPDMYKNHINSILCNDVEMTKIRNWEASHYTDIRIEMKEAHDALIANKSLGSITAGA